MPSPAAARTLRRVLTRAVAALVALVMSCSAVLAENDHAPPRHDPAGEPRVDDLRPAGAKGAAAPTGAKRD